MVLAIVGFNVPAEHEKTPTAHDIPPSLTPIEPPSGAVPAAPKAIPLPHTKIVPPANTVKGPPGGSKVTEVPQKPEPPISSPVVSPDPYFGLPSSTVAARTIEEANDLESLANRCSKDYLEAVKRQRAGLQAGVDGNGALVPGPEGVEFIFWRSYVATQSDAVATLHKSLLFRLGPVKDESETRAYNNSKEHENEMTLDDQVRHFGWTFCLGIPDYTREMRGAASMLEGNP
jgi:hypothetical protein